MSTFLERIGIFACAPDARPVAEIRADIDAELAYHVEESARELAGSGLSTDEARAEALRRFGDLGQIRRECARTQMGERIVLQRIQVVLTVMLLVAVGALLWSNREAQAQARAALDAEKQATAALMARLEARLAAAAVPGPAVYPFTGRGAGQAVIDRKPMTNVKTFLIGSGGYMNWDGQGMDLVSAAGTWKQYFHEQDTSWRHGLKVAGKLAELPGTQGVEMLTLIWVQLSAEHREQAMKPFVFDGGHPLALEVLALGFEDQTTSVKERAVLYLHTYAWKNLWRGETTGGTWFAQWRDRPVADVLRDNATRWAREYAEIWQSYDSPEDSQVDDLLAITEDVRTEAFAKAGVDLAAILKDAGVGAVGPEKLRHLSPKNRAQAERVLAWCKP